jgi:hypothetical protein
MEFNEIFEDFDTVAEFTSDAAAGMVPLSPDLVAEITQGDDEPRFATFVIESGWSKSKRYWGPELFDNVAEQINSGEPLVGYLGHISPEADPYAFPDIQFHWVKARVQKAGDKAKLAVKAYVLPGTKGRDYLKRRIANTVSWRGKAAQVPFQNGVRVSQFQIESIDLSRPRKNGMSARLVGALTSEMEDTEGGNSVKPEEIAALQENELRAHNAGLVSSIEAAARQPFESKVAEMETDKEKSDSVLGLIPEFRKVLGLNEDTDELGTVQAVISHLRAQGKSLRESVLDAVLAKRLKGGEEADRILLRRVLVGEMSNREISLTGDSDKDEKLVSEMVTEIVDADSSLKKLVSEMEEAPPAPPGTRQPNPGERAWKPGMSTSNVRVKARA